MKSACFLVFLFFRVFIFFYFFVFFNINKINEIFRVPYAATFRPSIGLFQAVAHRRIKAMRVNVKWRDVFPFTASSEMRDSRASPLFILVRARFRVRLFFRFNPSGSLVPNLNIQHSLTPDSSKTDAWSGPFSDT